MDKVDINLIIQEQHEAKPLYVPAPGTQYEVADGFWVEMLRPTVNRIEAFDEAVGYQNRVLDQAKVTDFEEVRLMIKKALETEDDRDMYVEVFEAVRSLRLVPSTNLQTKVGIHTIKTVTKAVTKVDDADDDGWPTDIGLYFRNVISRAGTDFTRASLVIAPPETPLSEQQYRIVSDSLSKLAGLTTGKNGEEVATST